uniref:Uncharacterized protein n=1 Tax=Onchocerca volvulus TaxID=6282 RepID=A0A8R1TVY2_ONCVO
MSSMKCSCPQVQQQLQQSNYYGCNLHGHIGQQCRIGCQQSCNSQCNSYMPQMHCENACLKACMQSCNLQQQSGNLPYWNTNINSLQQSYPYSHRQLQPITEQCITCLISCEKLFSQQQPSLNSNRLQCGCMQQCQQSCSMDMQSQLFSIVQQQQHQQCMFYCQQNCQQFCNQQVISSQLCQVQCRQQCINICNISPQSQFSSQSKCFDSCKQSCEQQITHCANPCNQNCQQFCHQQQQQQQPVPIVQQDKQAYKPQTIRVDLHPIILESAHCIPLCQQTCLQQCNLNLIKTRCQPAGQTICQQNCDHRQLQQQQQTADTMPTKSNDSVSLFRWTYSM